MKIKKYSNTAAALLFVGTSYLANNNYNKLNEFELTRLPQKQVSQNSIVPWIIGSSLLFAGGFLLFLIINRRKKLNKREKR